MFGRIFGHGKDEPDQAVCAECGRTLLAGEWTQKVVDADGEELLICSLCGQTHAKSGVELDAAGPTPANNGRIRESRSEAPESRVEARGPHAESDAFWIALKEKDAEIERLQARLVTVEAERQALADRLTRAQGAELPAEPLIPSAGVAEGAAAIAVSSTGDSSEPGERTWGETPAEFAAELAALRDASAASPTPSPDDVPPGATPLVSAAPVAAPAPDALYSDVPAVVFEDTQPIPTLTDEQLGEAAVQTPDIAWPSAPSADAHPSGDPETTLTPEPQPDTSAEPAPAAVSSIAAETAALAALTPTVQEPASAPVVGPATTAAEPAAPSPSAADLEAEAASLTLLQRGVDLLNVSRVPHKIAETNEQLGLPSVHVGFEGDTTAVTFIWSMGWYRFHVDSDSGDVRMVDRGYDELTDLRPNAGVRADGTVQLAAAQISRAAAQRPQPEAQPAPQPAAPEAAPAPAEPEPPSVAAQKPPAILSKSLLGQRSDDEAASWEKTQARDFDWDR